MRSHASTVSDRPKPQGMRTRISGSTSRTASHVVSTDRPPSVPRSSQPPARRTCSGTQCPTANGGSSHSRHATRGGTKPWSRRPTTISSTPCSRSRSPSTTSTAASSASVIAPTVWIELRMPSTDVGSRLITVTSPSRRRATSLTSLVPDGAHAAQLLGEDQVRLGGRERVLVERVQGRVGPHRRLDGLVDPARGRGRQVGGPAGHDGHVAHVRREVAVVADADELVAQARARTRSRSRTGRGRRCAWRKCRRARPPGPRRPAARRAGNRTAPRVAGPCRIVAVRRRAIRRAGGVRRA